MINEKADEVSFQSLLSRYQFGLQTSIKGRDFISDCVHLLSNNCHKINFKRDRL